MRFLSQTLLSTLGKKGKDVLLLCLLTLSKSTHSPLSQFKAKMHKLNLFLSCQTLTGWIQSAIFAEIFFLIYCLRTLFWCAYEGQHKRQTKHQTRWHGFSSSFLIHLKCWNSIFRWVTVALGMFQKLIIQHRKNSVVWSPTDKIDNINNESQLPCFYL